MKFKKITKPLWQTLGLGVLAGMRSTSAPAITSHILSHHNSGYLAKSMLDFMQSENVAIGLKVLAAGEVIADKLPNAPDRIKPASVVFRCLAGGLAGASIYRATGKGPLKGAVIGSLAALASTYGSFYLRQGIVKRFNVTDAIIGGLEDALVVGGGVGLAYSE